MDIRQAIVPSHFNQAWDIIPHRVGKWDLVYGRTLTAKLALIRALDADLIVSGDCMAAIGAHRNGLPLVWLDAHGDFHTVGTTETGHLGGMPLAMMCGLGDQSLMETCQIIPLTKQQVFHLGGSCFDAGEHERMLTHMTVIEATPSISAPIHLHVDTDVICQQALPSSIHPSSNGIKLALFTAWMEMLLRQTSVLSIKTYCPTLDMDGIGENIVLQIIRMYHDLKVV